MDVYYLVEEVDLEPPHGCVRVELPCCGLAKDEVAGLQGLPPEWGAVLLLAEFATDWEGEFLGGKVEEVAGPSGDGLVIVLGRRPQLYDWDEFREALWEKYNAPIEER